MFTIQCISNGWLIGILLVNGLTLCIMKLFIINVTFEMLYTYNHIPHFNENHFGSLSRHMATFKGKHCPEFFKANQCG